MKAIEREMSATAKRIMRLHALSKNPLLDEPLWIQPHMHCMNGG